jgi:hypothetical protein
VNDPRQQQEELPPPVSAATTRPQPSPQPFAPNQTDLLVEIQELRKLAKQLEDRVIKSTTSKQWRDLDGIEVSISPSASKPSRAGPTSPLDLRNVTAVVANLQRVSMGQSSQEPIYVGDLLFKIERIRAIPQAPIYTAQLGKPTPCVWLPYHTEARELLKRYTADLSYIQHVVHEPSLLAAIDNVYSQIDGQEPIKPSNLVLLLSIISNATHVWVPGDGVDNELSLFVSSAQANAQTPMWIQATQNVLNATQSGAALELETVQGIIILSFVVSNLEGVSLRYRSLISTGLLLSRELGLHRIDQDANTIFANTIQAEMGRRVWWYLVATDWFVFSMFLLLWLVEFSDRMIQVIGREIRRPE